MKSLLTAFKGWQQTSSVDDDFEAMGHYLN